jgi:hypothetical protein
MKLDHRTRPAMRDDEWHRFRVRRTDVQEMNVEPVDFGGELRKAIEPRLTPAWPSRLAAAVPRVRIEELFEISEAEGG